MKSTSCRPTLGVCRMLEVRSDHPTTFTHSYIFLLMGKYTTLWVMNAKHGKMTWMLWIIFPRYNHFTFIASPNCSLNTPWTYINNIKLRWNIKIHGKIQESYLSFFVGLFFAKRRDFKPSLVPSNSSISAHTWLPFLLVSLSITSLPATSSPSLSSFPRAP